MVELEVYKWRKEIASQVIVGAYGYIRIAAGRAAEYMNLDLRDHTVWEVAKETLPSANRSEHGRLEGTAFLANNEDQGTGSNPSYEHTCVHLCDHNVLPQRPFERDINDVAVSMHNPSFDSTDSSRFDALLQ